MSDYTPIVDFAAKDALATGLAAKKILGTEFTAELDAIATAIATKYDSTDIATTAEAQAETLSTVLCTPLSLSEWSDANGGMVGDIHALADPNADTVLGWDDSAGAVIGFTMGTGLGFNGTTLEISHLGIEDLVDPNADRVLMWDDSAGASAWMDFSDQFTVTATTLSLNITNIEADLNHDNLTGFVGNEHIDHSSVTLTAGAGLTGGGTIAANRTFAVGAGSGIAVNADDVAVDISGLTAFSGTIASTDGFLIDDGGTMKRLSYVVGALPVNSVTGANPTVTAAQMNSVISLDTAGSQTFDIDTGFGVAGNFLVIVGATSGTKTIAGTATINSAFTSDQLRSQYSVCVALCVASNTWVLYGDLV